jgi:hypothetical protein
MENNENNEKKIKNLKISEDVHNVLKAYCEKRGIKIYHFLEKMILEKCKDKKDIYGES